jgi:dsDNA-binding SOS-regulon protein
MEREPLLEAAKDAIGEGKKDDYVIAPSRHADELAMKAPALARILRKSELNATARVYEQKDAEAGQAQLVFKRAASRANWAVFLTACFSALLLVTAPFPVLSSGAAGKALQIALGLCGILSGAFGAMWLFKIREGKLLERWMTARAGAETRRLEYFALAATLRDDGTAGEIPLTLLQCEYFRRYQLDVQRAYYGGRAADHERAADRMLNVSAFAVGLACLATGFGGVLAGAVGGAWVALGGLGAIATGLAAFASANEAANQDRRNAERYRRTLDALEALSAKLDAVRSAAAQDEREPLAQFVAAVHEQLSLEHRQWLQTSESTAASIARLEQTLERAKASRSETAPAASQEHR